MDFDEWFKRYKLLSEVKLDLQVLPLFMGSPAAVEAIKLVIFTIDVECEALQGIAAENSERWRDED
jgi:hypothetical protein